MKIGPWGKISGEFLDVPKTPERLETVTIRSGVVVDSLAFSFVDQAGGQHTVSPWGDHEGMTKTRWVDPATIIYILSLLHVLVLARKCMPMKQLISVIFSNMQIRLAPSEIVTEVSGTTGTFREDDIEYNVIASLTIVTNVKPYGPFGIPQSTHFSVPIQEGGSIVGFFACAGKYVEALGVYARPPSVQN